MFGFFQLSRVWKLSLITIYFLKNMTFFFAEYMSTILSTLTLTITDPYQWLVYVLIIPIIHVSVLCFSFTVNITRTIVPFSLVKELGRILFGGLSIANWTDNSMFSPQNDQLVKLGLRQFTRNLKIKLFNRDIARLSLILSALVYENTGFVFRKALSYQLKHILLHNYSAQFRHIKTMVPLKVECVHIFFSVPFNVIIIVFKGTDPFCLDEVSIDASFEKSYASQFLWGDAHSGFYKAMFGKYRENSSKFRVNPMKNEAIVVESLDFLEESLFNQTSDAVNYIYFNYFLNNSPYFLITGHSLGGALATLFHARLLKVPNTIPLKINFIGSYTFGSPKTGSTNFCLEWLSAEEIRRIEKKGSPVHWRVVCGNDIVPCLPLSTNQGSTFANNLLNYSHTGTEVHLHHNNTYHYEHSAADIDYSCVNVKTWRYCIFDTYNFFKKMSNKGMRAVRTRNIAELLTVMTNVGVPMFVRDHFTSSYFELLENVEMKLE